MYHFCTYFDKNYLLRGLALYHSLKEHSPPFTLSVLCMDNDTYDTLTRLNMPELRPISIDDFEREDHELLIAKENRSRIEYYFTCSPCLPLYIFKTQPNTDLVTYLDADLFFFDSPAPLFEEMGNSSIAIIPHRFPPNSRNAETAGSYNVGYLSFRRDTNGMACLKWWKAKCIEWCCDKVEDNRFADQKYLDSFPYLFSEVGILQHKGANVAPWNMINYRMSYSRRKIFVDGVPLLFVHFHGLLAVRTWFYFFLCIARDFRSLLVIRRKIVIPYLLMLHRIAGQLTGTPISINRIRYESNTDRYSLLYRLFHNRQVLAKKLECLCNGACYFSIFGRFV